MNNAFAKEVNSVTLVYLDDILIFSRSIGEHWDQLQVALDRLPGAKLYGRLRKFEFLKDRQSKLALMSARMEFTHHLKRSKQY